MKIRKFKNVLHIHVSSKLRKPGFIEIKLQTIEVHLPDRHIHNKINVQPRLVMLVIQELNSLYLSHLYLPISDLFFQSLNKPVPNTSVNLPKPKLLSAAWSVISKTFSHFSHNQRAEFHQIIPSRYRTDTHQLVWGKSS